jgi:hypothetical protein
MGEAVESLTKERSAVVLRADANSSVDLDVLALVDPASKVGCLLLKCSGDSVALQCLNPIRMVGGWRL